MSELSTLVESRVEPFDKAGGRICLQTPNLHRISRMPAKGAIPSLAYLLLDRKPEGCEIH